MCFVYFIAYIFQCDIKSGQGVLHNQCIKYQWHSLRFKFSSDRNGEIVCYIVFSSICGSCVSYMDKFINVLYKPSFILNHYSSESELLNYFQWKPPITNFNQICEMVHWVHFVSSGRHCGSVWLKIEQPGHILWKPFMWNFNNSCEVVFGICGIVHFQPSTNQALLKKLIWVKIRMG